MLDPIKLSQVVSRFSPLLGSAIAIPSAFNLIDILLSRFKVPHDQPEKLIDTIDNHEEAEGILLDIQNNLYLELQHIAANHAANVLLTEQVKLQEETKRLDIDRLNVESARELAKISKIPAYLSLVVLVGFFTIMSMVVFIPIEAKDQNVLYILVGTLATNFSTVIAYWIGSSQSSKVKDIEIKSLLEEQGLAMKAMKGPVDVRGTIKVDEGKNHDI